MQDEQESIQDKQDLLMAHWTAFGGIVHKFIQALFQEMRYIRSTHRAIVKHHP